MALYGPHGASGRLGIMKLQKAFFIFFAAAALLAAAGTTSKVYLGDEVYHHRIAKYFFESGRPVTEPGYRFVPEAGYRVTGPTLWYEGLALAWKISGSVSSAVTQTYHAMFYFLLISAVFLLSKTLGNTDNQAFAAACFTASCPMITAFSVLLYLDVPACFWMVLTFLLVFKRKILLAGIAYAAFILTKEYAFLFAPGILLALFSEPAESLGKKMKNTVMFGAVTLLLILPDIYFRLKHFGYAYYAPPQPQFLNKTLNYWFTPASITRDPAGALAYLGAAIPLGFAVYLFFEKQKRKDWVLFVSLSIYFAVTLILLRRTLEMRYFMPAVVLLSVFAGKGLTQLKPSWLRGMFYGLFLLQFAGTAFYVHSKRQIPREVQEAFNVLSTPSAASEGALYPSESIMDYTGHPVIWIRVPDFQAMFWSDTAEKTVQALRNAKIAYVVVPEDRVYDDAHTRHTGGYPQSFVRRLKAGEFSSGIRETYSNSKISIWEVLKAAQ